MWGKVRAVLALSVGILLVAGLVVTAGGPAAARPPCDLAGVDTFAYDKSAAPSGEPVLKRPLTYGYENPARRFTSRAQPSASDLRGVPLRTSKSIYDNDDGAAWQALLSARLRNVAKSRAKGRPPAPWKDWLEDYIVGVGFDARGLALERAVPKALGLGSGWDCDEPIPGSPCGDRRYDYINVTDKIVIELKSGRKISDKQFNQDRCNAELKNGGWTVLTMMGEEPNARSLGRLNKFAKDKRLALGWFRLPTEASETGPFAPTPAPARAFVGQATRPGQGQALIAEAAGSVDNAEDAAAVADVLVDLAQAAGRDDDVDNLGGIDFSTLELRYLTDTYDKDGARAEFALTARFDDDGPWPVGGRRTTDIISDAFFVFMALPPDTLWVNLNPDEPDRIMDKRLGRTEPGRVMLEADLALKKTSAALTNPDTKTGRRFWAAAGESNGVTCLSSRIWIVPAAATVREDRDSLAIVKTELGVRTEADHSGPSITKACQKQSPTERERVNDAFRLIILPRLNDAVNNDPTFADLRRIFGARVAAEWMRDRKRLHTTAYDPEIDTGDVTAWPVEGSWTPNQTFKAYLKSYQRGEYKVTKRTIRRTRTQLVTRVETYTDGGVDFARSPIVRLEEPAGQAALPPLELIQRAAGTPVPAQELIWFGGQVAGDPERNGAADRQRTARLLRAAVIVGGALTALLAIAAAALALHRVRRP